MVTETSKSERRLFHRILVANRGEVASRVSRTCHRLGIIPVFAVSEADLGASYLTAPDGSDEAYVLLGKARAADSYLHMEKIVQAAVQTGCTAVHPGWGFLSENPRFAALCEAHGVTFVGPPASAMALMGKKTPAKKAMAKAGLTLIPGSDGVLADADAAEAVANEVGYPVLLKAESGGGGRGMRIARSQNEVRQAFEDARAEAVAAFGDDRVYLEKLVEGGRHVEIQIMADRYGNVIHVGERDCTVQRNHQKLIEESPAPTLDAEERARTLEIAKDAARSIGYVGAGTMEFLLDDGVLRFMEMNTRLQVEHSVSEVRSGLDLVELQLRVAAGQPLQITQDDVELKGHAIECRINAENPRDGFRPAPGEVELWDAPGGPELSKDGVRVDTHIQTGSVVSPHYDSLLCKVITYGETRDEACDRMIDALAKLRCDGLPTTAQMHQTILADAAFRAGDYDNGGIPGWPPAGKDGATKEETN